MGIVKVYITLGYHRIAFIGLSNIPQIPWTTFPVKISGAPDYRTYLSYKILCPDVATTSVFVTNNLWLGIERGRIKPSGYQHCRLKKDYLVDLDCAHPHGMKREPGTGTRPVMESWSMRAT